MGTQKIEMLNMFGYEENILTYSEIFQLFIAKYTQETRNPPTLNRLLRKFEDDGMTEVSSDRESQEQ